MSLKKKITFLNTMFWLLGSIGMDRVISELYFEGTILIKNYRKLWSFSCNSIVKILKVKAGPCFIRGLHCITFTVKN